MGRELVLTELAADLEPFIKGYIEEVVGEHTATGGRASSEDEFIIKLWDVSASKVREYNHDAAGLDAALADAASGDTIVIPPGTIPDAHTIGNGVEVVGLGTNSILSGDLTVNNGRLNNLFITEVDVGAAFLYGVEQGTVSGNAIFGYGNDIGGGSGNPQYCIIGGTNNAVEGDYNIVGGDSNTVTWACTSSIIAGYDNTVSDNDTVCFGRKHTISGAYGGILSGHTNTATADYAVVIGGTGSQATGDYTLAWGVQARPSHAGSMLFADNNAFNFASAVADEFAVRATGGFRFVCAIDGAGAATKTVAASTGGALVVPGNLTIGDGSAGVNFTLTVNGETSDGVITWMEDESVWLLADGLAATPDEITATDAGVAASIATLITEVTTNGDSDLDNVTLANGISGQVKIIKCVVEGNAADTWKITPANMVGGTQITFAGVGLGCILSYADNEGWSVDGNNGGVIT